MTRRFTDRNVRTVLNAWPQAISADSGDLRVLHDIANEGAQSWGERLRWPDYVWLGLARPSVPPPHGAAESISVLVQAPPGSGAHADLGKVSRAGIQVNETGTYSFSGSVDCLLEVKAITVDHLPKFASYGLAARARSWQSFVEGRLATAFSRVWDADQQLRDGRRILGKTTGITIVVNEGSRALPAEVAHAALARAIQRLPNTDAIVYLADGHSQSHVAVVHKRQGNGAVTRFQEEFVKMLDAVEWNESGPTLRGGPYPRLTIRIDMDDQSLAMYRTWSTGWRAVDDPRPIPIPSPRFSIVDSDQFQSGLLSRKT